MCIPGYPDVAWLQGHQRELNDVLLPLQTLGHRGYGYDGPWLEHEWIAEVKRKSQPDSYGYPFFAHWVLLLVPWLSIQAYPDVRRNVTQLLVDRLRPHVCYATVFTDDCSFARVAGYDFPGVTVMELQAGAARGIELPMLKQPIDLNCYQPEEPRRYYLSFVGNPDNGLLGLRREMIMESAKAFDVSTEFYYRSSKAHKHTLAEFSSLLDLSEFVLCPRGFGPTSYRFYEALSAGAIPVYVWEGELVQ